MSSAAQVNVDALKQIMEGRGTPLRAMLVTDKGTMYTDKIIISTIPERQVLTVHVECPDPEDEYTIYACFILTHGGSIFLDSKVDQWVIKYDEETIAMQVIV